MPLANAQSAARTASASSKTLEQKASTLASAFKSYASASTDKARKKAIAKADTAHQALYSAYNQTQSDIASFASAIE